MTLRKDYWVIMTSRKTSQTLPITLVSHHLQNEFALRMKAIGYDVDAFFDKNAYARVKPLHDIQIQTDSSRSEDLLVNDRAKLLAKKRDQ